MNIVIPCAINPNTTNNAQLPVLVYIHGGSLLYGGANLPIFDAVNLVSHSIAIGQPIIVVNFNYRVGIGGFLAGDAIARELARDGFAGNGNFGFTDQQVAFEWVQRYIPFLGGDAHNVTAVGESAGSISISNQLLAANPPIFNRAACMSGLSAAIPAWTMEQHDRFFGDVCHHLGIDPASPGALDRLRAVPQQELANATPLIQCVPSGTGNPCLDGWFYGNSDPRDIHAPPAWLEGLTLGDTYHEGVIFHLNLLEEEYESIRRTLQTYIENEAYTDQILDDYGINKDLSHEELLLRVEHMCGDAIFKIPNYVLAQTCLSKDMINGTTLFMYHFDQRSRIPNAFEGTAYHAHELLYLFGNLDNAFNENERRMAREFASAWIRFVNGLETWDASEKKWMVWGPDSSVKLKSEEEDDIVRDYARMKKVLNLGSGEIWKKWLAGVDALVNHRQHWEG